MKTRQLFQHPLVVASLILSGTLVVTQSVTAKGEPQNGTIDARQFRLLDSGVKNLRADLSLNAGGNGASMHFYDSDETPVIRIMSKNGKGSIALWDGSNWKPVLTR